MVARFEKALTMTKKYFSPQELNALVEEMIELVRPEADEKGIIILFNRHPANLNFQGNRHLIR
uniref:hypothetical protein n=1 Tax=Dissulfurimicrobium sp. TaxID=2022436 RepID=UPI00404A4A5E